MEEKKNIPLSVLMENTKGKMTAAVNQIVNEAKLPAYLIEGILLGILSDVRNQKNLELISDYNAMNQEEKEGEE
ncbi:hypothetical protein [uncultured Eubacterium sp.]|uniref:hypothetical protein n=1 Tax=uncultured Eubacterium sp. TaxID=165185 RepID=UPI00261E449D|nr:hypothetical protein [uncultured Eubacterium sp.]